MQILNIVLEVGNNEDDSEFIELPVDKKTTSTIKKLLSKDE